MTRKLQFINCGTNFGQWIRKYCRNSIQGLSNTDLDQVLYILEDFREREHRKYMIVEEKKYKGKLYYGQAVTFQGLDCLIRLGVKCTNYEYWGFYIIQFSNTFPGDSELILINGNEISKEKLRDHLNFDNKFCQGLNGNDPNEWNQFINNGSLKELENLIKKSS